MTTLSIQNRKPLCYLLQNSNLLLSLPYVDQDQNCQNGTQSHTNFNKSKILYLIKTQQNQMNIQNPIQMYLKNEFECSKHKNQGDNINFLNSQRFQQELQRVKLKLQKKNKKQQKQILQIQKDLLQKGKLPVQGTLQKVNESLVQYESARYKNINTQMQKHFGPQVMKTYIQNLQKEKQKILEEIKRQRQEIQQLNQMRKYQQLQASQRQNTIKQRIKVMIYKKRKLQ